MLASMAYQILASADFEALREAYEVYEEAIRPSERKPFGALRTMLARADYRFAMAREAGTNAVVGVAVLFVAADFGLMEYLAVAPARRSAGVGSGLFRYGAGLVPGPVLVEVDLPETAAAGGAERAVCERRVAFYRRVGCRQLAGLTYRLPLPGDPPPMGLFLYAPEAQTAVPLGTVRRYVTTLYTRVYGRRSDDPQIDAMLARLPDPVRLV